MRVCKWVGKAAGVLAFLAFSGAASAQCAGFTDVPDDGTGPAAFCPSVQWVKNRSVTLGCTSATLYCPTAAVSRLAMAAFLHRVGKALTPEEFGSFFYTTPNPFPPNPRENISGSPILCQNAQPYVVTGYPRRATFNAKVNVFNPSADVELVADVMYSTAGGAPGSWTSVQGTQTYQTLRAGGTVPDDVTMYPVGGLNLEVGQSYTFGIRIARVVPTGGTGDPYLYCENRVSIGNRNPASGVFLDEEAQPPRTGRAAQLPGQ
jgi:hypothetical protein